MMAHAPPTPLPSPAPTCTTNVCGLTPTTSDLTITQKPRVLNTAELRVEDADNPAFQEEKTDTEEDEGHSRQLAWLLTCCPFLSTFLRSDLRYKCAAAAQSYSIEEPMPHNGCRESKFGPATPETTTSQQYTNNFRLPGPQSRGFLSCNQPNAPSLTAETVTEHQMCSPVTNGTSGGGCREGHSESPQSKQVSPGISPQIGSEGAKDFIFIQSYPDEEKKNSPSAIELDPSASQGPVKRISNHSSLCSAYEFPTFPSSVCPTLERHGESNDRLEQSTQINDRSSQAWPPPPCTMANSLYNYTVQGTDLKTRTAILWDAAEKRARAPKAQ